MTWTLVNSSFIRAIGFDGGTLGVAMLSGRTYYYHGVSISVYHAFLEADSHGEYFNAFIKGQYQ